MSLLLTLNRFYILFSYSRSDFEFVNTDWKMLEAIVRRCSIKKVFLKMSPNSQENQNRFFNKVAGLRSATLLKKRLWSKCFPVNFVKFLRAPISIKHLWWLLLKYAAYDAEAKMYLKTLARRCPAKKGEKSHQIHRKTGYRCFPMNFAKCLRIHSIIEHLRRLSLCSYWSLKIWNYSVIKNKHIY